MTIAEIIAVAVIALLVGCAVGYIIKAKRSNRGCIGCPDSARCAKGHACCHTKKEDTSYQKNI